MPKIETEKFSYLDYSITVYKKNGTINFRLSDFIELIKAKKFIEDLDLSNNLYGFKIYIQEQEVDNNFGIFYGNEISVDEIINNPQNFKYHSRIINDVELNNINSIKKYKFISSNILNEDEKINVYPVKDNFIICLSQKVLLHTLINLIAYISQVGKFSIEDLNLENLMNQKIIFFAPDFINLRSQVDSHIR